MILDVLAEFIEIVITYSFHNRFWAKWENVISTLKLSGWPTNLVFSQLKEYSISLNCYKDVYP